MDNIKELELDILNRKYCKKVKCNICPIKGDLKNNLCVEIRYRPKVSTVKKLLKLVKE